MALSQHPKVDGKMIFAVYNGQDDGLSLAEMAARLLAGQKEGWPALRDGYAGLESSLIQEIDGGNWKIQIQCNPRRMASSGADVHPEAIKNRRCFLCPENRPVEQQAILYRGAYHILCNPAPIFPRHLTIAHIRHIPQSLGGNVETMLLLAEDFGPATAVFYNGPRSGASAPDHLHFQAAPYGLMPIKNELDRQTGKCTQRIIGNVAIFRTEGLGRGVLVLRGNDGEAIVAMVGKILAVLSDMTAATQEPLVNVLCVRFGCGWQLLIFPRLKHRPDAFFSEGERRLIVSPGSADMAGVMITPRQKDFHRLTADVVASLYREVAFDDIMVEKLLAKL